MVGENNCGKMAQFMKDTGKAIWLMAEADSFTQMLMVID